MPGLNPDLLFSLWAAPEPVATRPATGRGEGAAAAPTFADHLRQSGPSKPIDEDCPVRDESGEPADRPWSSTDAAPGTHASEQEATPPASDSDAQPDAVDDAEEPVQDTEEDAAVAIATLPPPVVLVPQPLLEQMALVESTPAHEAPEVAPLDAGAEPNLPERKSPSIPPAIDPPLPAIDPAATELPVHPSAEATAALPGGVERPTSQPSVVEAVPLPTPTLTAVVGSTPLNPADALIVVPGHEPAADVAASGPPRPAIPARRRASEAQEPVSVESPRAGRTALPPSSTLPTAALGDSSPESSGQLTASVASSSQEIRGSAVPSNASSPDVPPANAVRQDLPLGGPLVSPNRDPWDQVGRSGIRPGVTEASLPPLTDAERGRLLDRVTRAVAAAGPRGGVVRLRLSPPELGALVLEVTLRDGTLSARVEAETTHARQLLLDGLPALRERLAAQQITIERFDVDLSGQSAGGAPHQPADDPRPHQEALPPAQRRAGRQPDEPAPAAAPVRSANSQHLNVII